jgi:hypothetical protein
MPTSGILATIPPSPFAPSGRWPYGSSASSAAFSNPIAAATMSAARIPATLRSEVVVVMFACVADRGLTYFATTPNQPGPERGPVSIHSSSRPRQKIRRSAMIFPFAVSAAAYWPRPGVSAFTSFVTRPVIISAAFAPRTLIL